MHALNVYSRKGCHLCELLIEELLPLVRGHLTTVVCDIDKRPDWRASYGTRVPVVEYEGTLVSEYPLDHEAVARLLDSLS